MLEVLFILFSATLKSCKCRVSSNGENRMWDEVLHDMGSAVVVLFMMTICIGDNCSVVGSMETTGASVRVT